MGFQGIQTQSENEICCSEIGKEQDGIELNVSQSCYWGKWDKVHKKNM